MHAFDCFLQPPVPTEGHRKINPFNSGQTMHQLRRVGFLGIRQVKDAAPRGVRGERPILTQLRELRADGKSQRLGNFRGDSRREQHRGAGVIRDQEIIGAATEPNRVHRDGIGHDYDPLAIGRAGRPEHFIEHVGVGGIDRDDDVGPEAGEQPAEVMLQGEKDFEVAGEVLLPVEQAVNYSPAPRRLVDEREIGSPRPIIGHAIGVGKKVMQLDQRFPTRDLREAIPNPARRAVMSLAESGGEDQNFFQDSLDRGGAGSDWESLMDIWARQSKLSTQMKRLGFVGRIVRRMVWETAMDDTTGLAAQMAYQFLFTLAPGLLFLWHLLGLFGTDPARLYQMFAVLKSFLPPDPKVQDILDSLAASVVETGATGPLANVGIIAGILLGTLFISTISHALSRTHGVVEDRNWWSKYIISFFLLFWFGITILFCFNAMVFGETLAGIAEVNFQLGVPLQQWVAALNLPLTALALIGLALALYLLTPENYLTTSQALPGAIFFSIGWITVTKLFQFYVARYNSYNPTYLALASIIVLLTWMYLTCLLLLLGGKLNAILRRERERAAVAAAELQPA